ncbi:hemagglutinin repeat-containing protein [Herbaspirillum rubrisubalbicans]|uniref:hemagglutinin repeat-containing protein n=1 Tax=Herbaspirillum rubrisubalbicans TaxID=80842 RepID=UPI000DD2F06D|nr:hemagglutinin repeat-containing protein [Herbaspirillum rubrisubalbicans]
MNQLCYRIIFNKTRGQFMAVAETTRACAGKTTVGSRPGIAQSGLPVARLSWIGLAVLLFTGGAIATMPRAYAQIIADPGAPRAQQPVVINTANGVPQVNIQTPSAAGVSRNTYSQFDVNRAGAILNNSRSDIQTQQGGWIQRNPNLATGTARVILNEVNSSSPSMLRGFVEVAGDRAQVIIANPSGVTCDGCGFINASRSTLTTGSPVMNNGSLDGYVVRGGRVRIEGAGLSDMQSDYTDIIARATEINAGIWAKELRVTTGTNRVNAEHTQVTAMAAQDAAPAFGVDVGQLGGMYANKIFLVGTEAGVGVRNAGKMGAAIGEIVLTADGRIENSGKVSAQERVRIQSSGTASSAAHEVVNTGEISSVNADVSVQSDGRIDNGGTVAAQGAIDLSSQSLRNSGSLSAAGGAVAVSTDGSADNSGRILAATEVRIASGTATNSGSIAAANGDIRAQTRSALSNTGTLVAQRDVVISAQQTGNSGAALVNAGAVSAVGGAVSINASGGVDNTGNIVARDHVQLDVSAVTGGLANLVNSGNISTTQGSVSLHTDGRIDNGGVVTAQTSVDIVARQAGAGAGPVGLNNTGAISAAGGTASLAITGAIDNSGKILSRDRADISIIAAAGNQGIGGRYGLRNTGDLGVSNGAMQLNVDGGVLNTGAVMGQQGVMMAARAASRAAAAGAPFDIDNTGSIHAANGQVQLMVDGHIVNGGTIIASQSLSLIADNLGRRNGVGNELGIANTGTIGATGGGASLQANGAVQNGGVIAAQGDVSIEAAQGGATLTNQGKIQTATGTAILKADGLLTNTASGQITGRNLSLSAQDVENNGSIGAQANASLGSRSGFRQASTAAFAAAGSMAINLPGNYTNAGQLRAGSLSLSAAQIANLNTGAMQADGMIINASGMLSNAGEISTRNQLDVTAAEVGNTGVILGDNLTVTTGTLNNVGSSALLGGGSSVSLWVSNLLYNRNNAVIYSAGNLSIAANAQRDASGLVSGTAQISNEDAIMEAGGNLDMAAVNLRNTRSGVAVNTVRTLDETYAMHIASWWHNGGNEHYYKPDSSNFTAYEILYVNPADVLETKSVVTPDGYVIGRAVIRTHADDTVFYKGMSSAWDSFGQVTRGSATDGTRVLYFTEQRANISNPDKVSGGDDPRDGRNDVSWQPMPGYSNQYGNCTNNCIRFVTEKDYTDPNTTFLRNTQRILAPQHDSLEVTRNAHHTASEDQLAPGAGSVAEIRAGGNANIRIAQSLSNEFSNIVANGALWLGGSNASITNLGQTLYRRHNFDGKFVTTGGLVVAYSMPSIAEVIGTTQGAIVGNGGLNIVANNFSNTDLSAGSAANIRNDITPTTGSGQSIGGLLGNVAGRPGVTTPGGALPSTGGLPSMSGFPAGASFPQNGNVPLPLRPGVLFRPSASASYLLETRSQFTDHRTWLSSDYLLTALNVDPSTTQKRLGDGFYEQRLVREQMAQLTGRPSGSANDDSQYQQLLTNAVSVAKRWDLRPGVALTAEQVSHLTSDIVWLESQKVVLPDGRTEDVLVPRLYLAHVDKDALLSSGALISGSDITIQAENITNKGGFIDGRASGNGRTVLVAANDLSNLGGKISGDEIVISAGRNVNNEALTVTQNYANGQTSGSYTSLSNQGSIAAGKNLTISAGADISNLGSTLASGRLGDATSGNLSLSAGRDIKLDTIKTSSTYNANFSGYLGSAQSVASVGSNINAGSNLTLVAQRDLSMTAAQVDIGSNGIGSGSLMAGRAVTIGAALDQSESMVSHTTSRSYVRADDQGVNVVGSNINAADGISIKAGLLEQADVKVAASNITAGKALAVAASGDIDVVSEDAYRSHSEYATSSSRGFLSSKSSSSYRKRSYTDAISSNLNGDAVTLQAGGDMNIVGSNVVSNSDTSLSAGNNIAISSATSKFEEVNQHSEKSSGFFARGGAGVLSVGYGSASANGESTSKTQIQQGSNIVSLNGSTQVKAGRSLSVVASDLYAAKDLTLIGASIDLAAAQNTSVDHSNQQSSSSGFSLGLTYNPMAAFKSAYQQSAKNNPSTSLVGKSLKYGEAVTEGALAATTPIVVQAGSRSSNANQDYARSDAKVSTLTAGRNLTLLATDGSITSQGTVMSAEGNALLVAKNNIDLNVARSYQEQGQSNLSSGWSIDNRGIMPAGVFDGKNKGNGTSSSVTGTSLSVGGNASLSTTQGDVTLTAANLVAHGDVAINAAKNLTIQSGQDIASNANSSSNQAVGKVVISDTERFAGYHTEKSQANNSTVTQVASNVGSLQGNVSLSAGDSYTQTASNVLAANNVDINAKAININTANNTGSNDQSSSSLKVGVFARVSSPLIDLANNVDNARKSDGRLQAMQALAAGANAYQAVSAVPGGSGSILKGEVGVGFASANSQDRSSYVEAQGSTIQGGNNVTLTSTQGDIHATGASIAAGKGLTLDSARNILLDAGQSTVTGSGDNHSAGAEIGVGYSIGAKSGIYAYISANIGNGRYDYNALTNSNTHLSGDAVVLKSKADTTLKGADVNANTINAEVGGKLAIESVQDKVTQHSEQSSIGGRVQISIGSAWEASGSASRSNANGSSSFVNQQSGLFARDGGYHVTADSIALKGGAIASTNADNSALTTNSIRFENIQNKMEYSADTMSLSGGISGGGKPAREAGESGKPAQQADGKDRLSSGAPTPNLTPGIPMQDSGSSNSNTYATLTDGKINIGGQSLNSAAGLGAHTDLATANNAIEALPDLRNVMKEQQAMAAAANTVVATSVQIAGDLAAAAQKRGDEDGARDWGPLGDNTRALKAITGALVGAIAGQGTSQIATNAAAPYVAQAIGEYFSQPGNESKSNQLLSHAVLGAILAAANGGRALAGGAAGVAGQLAAESITKSLYPQAFDDDGNFHPERLDASQANTIVALSSAVGMMVANLAGGSTQNALIGANVATNGVMNNWLGDHQRAAMDKELSIAKSVADKLRIVGKYLVISGRQDILTATGIGLGLAEAGWSDVQGLSEFLQHPEAGLNGLKSLINSPDARAALGDAVYDSINKKIDSMSAALATGGDDAALQLGKDIGSLLWQVGSAVSGVAGATEAVASLAKVGVKVTALTASAMTLAAKILKNEAKGLGGIVDISDIGMTFGAGIKGQGLPFEAYVQSKLPAGTLDLNSIKTNFEAFDHLTKEGLGVSSKTLDTTAKTYQNPSAITNQLNRYIDKMDMFSGDGKVGEIFIAPEDILSKQMQLAIPASTNTEQLAAIAKSIQYAQSKQIQIVVTKIK